MLDRSREFNPLLFEEDYEEYHSTEIVEESPDISDSTNNVDDDKIQKREKDEFLIDLCEEVSELNYTIEINRIKTFPKGDIQGIKAKAKQGKTHAILCIMIALLRGEFLTIKSLLSNPRICYFATEEHHRSLHQLVKKVHKLCEWDINMNNEYFKVFTLRRQNPKERSEYIEKQIRKNKPDVVFVDGIRDLLYDFNNIQE